ncbi:MAG: Gfo/Idh/MocA family oxidoreductase [Cyclobacteriaceae bacterium]|nr:Gfo/Idh/MocA family oxidoreductase [Cyclobacteriaceae bacterium]
MERRNFIKNTVMAGMTLSIQPNESVLGSNDQINLAVIGLGSKVKIGGKGKKDLRDFMKIPRVNIVAICDVDEEILREEVQKLKKNNIKVKAYKDFRKLLDDKDIDAVSITTPNHSHAIITIMACQAGKHVFCQKPASHNIFEGRKMVEAAKKYNRIVQVPHGARSPNGFREAFAWARSGKLGKINYVHGLNYKPRMSIEKVSAPVPVPKSIDYNLWAGPAQMSPVRRKYFHYDWHWNWDNGNGDLGNMGIHYIDGCRMAIDANYLPKHVMSIGGRLGYDDDGQTPNTQILYFEYEEAPIIFEVRGLPSHSHFLKTDWKSKSRISMDSYRGVKIGVVVHCEDGYIANNQAFDNRGRLLETFESNHETDKENFINAVKKNDPDTLYTDVEVGHLSAALVHLGNASYRIGKKSDPNEIYERIRGKACLEESFDRFRNHLFANRIDWEKEDVILGPMLSFDSDSEKFVGEFAQQANQQITRKYREPFVVPDKV